jgi:hypothetical protein
MNDVLLKKALSQVLAPESAGPANRAGNKKGSRMKAAPRMGDHAGVRSDHQGREKVLTLVKLFIASMTPSL